MIKKMILGALALGFFATSCSNDDDATAASTTSPLSVGFNGLEALGADYVYEGWIMVDGTPVSTGTFSSVGNQTFQVNTVQLNAATAFILSIEPAIDPDPLPAATKVLSGTFSGSTANINTGLVGDFSTSTGTFFLRTPTDEMGMNNGNDENGVWFGAPGMPPTANFTLPVLPAGWAYEGWVVGETGPLTTGTFTDFSAADGETPFSGASAGPPVPGEDFFENAPAGETFPLDVRNRMVVISVEPVPDNSPAPFAMKPLVGTAGTTTAPATHDFGLNLASLPTGTVTR